MKNTRTDQCTNHCRHKIFNKKLESTKRTPRSPLENYRNVSKRVFFSRIIAFFGVIITHRPGLQSSINSTLVHDLVTIFPESCENHDFNSIPTICLNQLTFVFIARFLVAMLGVMTDPCVQLTDMQEIKTHCELLYKTNKKSHIVKDRKKMSSESY